MDLASVQIGSMSNCVDGLQDVPKLQDLNKLISRHVNNISDIWISFFLR